MSHKQELKQCAQQVRGASSHNTAGCSGGAPSGDHTVIMAGHEVMEYCGILLCWLYTPMCQTLLEATQAARRDGFTKDEMQRVKLELQDNELKLKRVCLNHWLCCQ